MEENVSTLHLSGTENTKFKGVGLLEGRGFEKEKYQMNLFLEN